MSAVVNHFAANLHGFVLAVQFSPSIHVAYRTAVESGIGHMQVGIKLQIAQYAVQRSLTGNLALRCQREFRHGRQSHNSTQVNILEFDMD